MLSFARQFRVLLLLSSLQGAGLLGAEYAVNRDGSGKFTTIQSCADAVKPGDTCLVYPGVYGEHVKTAIGGGGKDRRIVFKAQGAVTMQGFDIRHEYVTVDGFEITGYDKPYQGLI